METKTTSVLENAQKSDSRKRMLIATTVVVLFCIFATAFIFVTGGERVDASQSQLKILQEQEAENAESLKMQKEKQADLETQLKITIAEVKRLQTEKQTIRQNIDNYINKDIPQVFTKPTAQK